jgi:hypothetical protein
MDPWEQAGHDPPVDPRPGTGSWDLSIISSKYAKGVVPKRLYGWQLEAFLNEPEFSSSKERLTMWTPARFKVGEDGEMRRRAEDVESVSMFVVDSDNGASLDVLKRLGHVDGADGYSLLRFGHTTYSHSAAKTKARVVFPLCAPVPAERWPDVWAAAERWVGSFGVKNDPSTKNPNRIWFKASCEQPELFESWVFGSDQAPKGARTAYGAALLDPAWLIRKWMPPKTPPKRIIPPSVVPAWRPHGSPHERQARLAISWLNKRIESLASKPQGERSNYCFSLGICVAQSVTSGWVFNPSHWEEQVVQAAMAAGLTEEQARAQFHSGMKRGEGQQWQEVIDAAR